MRKGCCYELFFSPRSQTLSSVWISKATYYEKKARLPFKKRNETKTETGHGNIICSQSLPRPCSRPNDLESPGTYSSICQVFLMIRITCVPVRCRNLQPPPGPTPDPVNQNLQGLGVCMFHITLLIWGGRWTFTG